MANLSLEQTDKFKYPIWEPLNTSYPDVFVCKSCGCLTTEVEFHNEISSTVFVPSWIRGPYKCSKTISREKTEEINQGIKNMHNVLKEKIDGTTWNPNRRRKRNVLRIHILDLNIFL